MRATIVRALAILTVGFATTFASGGPPAQPVSDVELALKVRNALAAEPDLAGLNLLISVRDRVALVGGPVPASAVPARIETVLKALPGLDGAKVSCWVATADDPLQKLVADRMKAPPAGPLVPPLALPVQVPPSNWPSPLDTPPPVAVVATEDRRPTGIVTVQRFAPPAGGFLLDPIARGGEPLPMLPMPAAVVAAYPTIPSPSVPTTPSDDPFAAAKASNARFAGLSATPSKGTVVIAGRVSRDADVWAFADAVRKLPGVTRVIIGRVDVR